MNESKNRKVGGMLAGMVTAIVLPAHADSFGSGSNTLVIDFVDIGNAGNGDDAGAGGGLYSAPYGGVPYEYRIGMFEISQIQIDIARLAAPVELANVTAGPHAGGKPAAMISWLEAAAFVNWLNTSTGHHKAYDLDATVTAQTLWDSSQAWQAGGENLYRHKDAYYFLPSEDEWYKAAYHKNDGVTANYWDYATASNAIPFPTLGGTSDGTAVCCTFDDPTTGPADVAFSGGLSAYGTRGQNGNVWEWQESAFTGANDSATEGRAIRGGDWWGSEFLMRPTFRDQIEPTGGSKFVGFRVASVPEPSAATLMLGTCLICFARRCRVTRPRSARR